MYSELILPALRANMGDWTYYITSMSLMELSRRVTTASVVHESESLDKMIQRSRSPRADDIADYLLSQPQRLFGTLVVGVYGGEPEWLEVAIEERSRPWEGDGGRLVGAIGLLRLAGSEQLFALDGQHRLLGTERALRRDPSLGAEEVAVVFVGHSNDAAGLERTRRLFSTLNRYAKPVSKSEIIALDEDDASAIVTRRLIDVHPLFRDRVALGKTKAVAQRDRRNVTSVVALYDCVEMILKSKSAWHQKDKRFRPSEAKLNEYTRHCVEYWDVVIGENDVLETYLATATESRPAEPFRGTWGGHLLFRPIGILAHTWAATALCVNEGMTIRTAIRRLSAVPMQLNDAPWAGVLWDVENHRMRTAKEGQRVAKWIMYYATGGTLERVRSSEGKLQTELAGLLNKAVDDVVIPRYYES